MAVEEKSDGIKSRGIKIGKASGCKSREARKKRSWTRRKRKKKKNTPKRSKKNKAGYSRGRVTRRRRKEGKKGKRILLYILFYFSASLPPFRTAMN